jgi:hypothetical protein
MAEVQGIVWSIETLLYDTIIVDAQHYTFVKAHRIFYHIDYTSIQANFYFNICGISKLNTE